MDIKDKIKKIKFSRMTKIDIIISDVINGEIFTVNESNTNVVIFSIFYKYNHFYIRKFNINLDEEYTEKEVRDLLFHWVLGGDYCII